LRDKGIIFDIQRFSVHDGPEKISDERMEILKPVVLKTGLRVQIGG